VRMAMGKRRCARTERLVHYDGQTLDHEEVEKGRRGVRSLTRPVSFKSQQNAWGISGLDFA
jgi:hypothetical protein